MASEFLKIQALNKYIKEPKVKDFSFDLRSSSTEDFLFPEPKPEEELTRIKEENFEKAKPFLMDESVDFIEREEFNEGKGVFKFSSAQAAGGGTPAGTYPKSSPLELKKLRDILNSLPDGSDVGLQTLQKQTGVDRGTIRLIVQREFPNLNVGGKAAMSANMKKVNELRKAKGFRAGVNMEEYIKDYSEKFKLPKGSIFSKAMSNKDLAIKYFGDASEKNLARVDRINNDLRKQLKLTYPKGDPNKGYITREERKKKFTPSADDKFILNQQKKQKKLINNYFKNNPEKILEKPQVLKMINAKLKDGKLDFTPRYDTPEEYVELAKKGKLFDEFDITPIRSEKRGIMYPANKNVSPGKFNQAFIKSVDAYYRKTKGSKDADVIANKQAIENFLKEVGIRVNVEGQMIGEKVLPAIDRNRGNLPNIDNTLRKLDLSELAQNVSIADTAATKLGMNVDPSEILRAVDTDYMKTKTPSIKGLKTVAKVGLGEAYFAPASIVMDSYAGLTGPEMALNIATFGTGVPIKDSIEKRKFLNELDLGSAFNTAMEKRRILKTAPKSSVGDYTEDERKAIFASNVFDTGLGMKRKAKREDDLEQMKADLQSGALEVKDYTDVPEPEGIMGIEPELIEIPEDLGFFNKAAGQTPRGFLSQGGIVQTRVGFAAGSQGPIPLRVLFLIMDKLQNLKNSTFSNYNSVRMFGEQKGIKEVLSPYTNIPEKNRLVTAIEDATELKKIMPEEYHGILDEIIKDSQQFNFKTAHDRTQAVIDTLPPNLDFKQLPEDLFPLPNPENSSFILPKGYGKGTNFQTGRFKTRTSVDSFTGKGTREVYDTFDEETGEFIEPGKLVSKEPIEDELSEIFATIGKPNETN